MKLNTIYTLKTNNLREYESNYHVREVSKNLQASVDAIYKDIKLSDNKYSTILFSPAAASFDQFKNFEDRGEYFKKLILKKFKREANV